MKIYKNFANKIYTMKAKNRLTIYDQCVDGRGIQRTNVVSMQNAINPRHRSTSFVRVTGNFFFFDAHVRINSEVVSIGFIGSIANHLHIIILIGEGEEGAVARFGEAF